MSVGLGIAVAAAFVSGAVLALSGQGAAFELTGGALISFGVLITVKETV